MAARGAGQSISLLKRAFHEVPDLVLSCSLGVAGILVTGVFVAKHINNFDEDHKHKHKYTVLRREDVDDEKKIGPILN